MEKVYLITNQCGEDYSARLFKLTESEATFLEKTFRQMNQMNSDSIDSYPPTLSIKQVDLEDGTWRKFNDIFFANEWISLFGMQTEKILELDSNFYIRSDWE